MPDRLELLSSIAVENVFDFRRPSINGELRHASADFVAWWVEREAAIEVVANAIASQREVDAWREQRVLVAGWRK